MKKITLAAALVLGLGLAACSQETKENAADTADSIGRDVDKAADATGAALDDAAKSAGEAADKAAASTDELGDKVKEKAAEVEASAHNETVEEAKAD